jgi:hypothetical protein
MSKLGSSNPAVDQYHDFGRATLERQPKSRGDPIRSAKSMYNAKSPISTSSSKHLQFVSKLLEEKQMLNRMHVPDFSANLSKNKNNDNIKDIAR